MPDSIGVEWLFLISLVAGFIGAMSGMGGGVVLIPALTLFRLDIKEAIALSMVSVIATSSGAASAYVRDRITNLKVGMFLEMFTICGALVGAGLSLATAQRWLFILFGLVLLASWLAMYLQQHFHGGPLSSGRLLPLAGIERELSRSGFRGNHSLSGKCAYLGGPMMFGAGLVAGMLGLGAGALKVMIFDLVMGLPSKVSTTTSNLIIGVTALGGTSIYLAAGKIDPGLAVPVIVGITIGAFLGTRLLVRITNQAVRRFFLAVLLILGLEMIIRGIRGG